MSSISLLKIILITKVTLAIAITDSKKRGANVLCFTMALLDFAKRHHIQIGSAEVEIHDGLVTEKV